MNISTNYSTQAFQARIKMNQANAQLFKNAVLGSTAIAAGAASIAAGVDSACIVTNNTPSVYGSVASPETIAFAQDSLVSHAPEGMPAQATALPLGLSSYGLYNVQIGVDYLNKEIPD